MSKNKKEFFHFDLLNTLQELTKNYDIGYIFNNMQSLLNLSIPIKTRELTNEQYSKNKKLALKTQQASEYALDEFKTELHLRKSLFAEIRETYPSFCTDMKEKISEKDYNDYLKLLKIQINKIDKLLLSDNNRTSHYYSELLLEKQDKLSAIIDSESSTRLSQIEDQFVLNELNSIDYSNFSPQTIEQIDALKSTLEDRLQKAEFFNTLYSKRNKINIAKSFNVERELLD